MSQILCKNVRFTLTKMLSTNERGIFECRLTLALLPTETTDNTICHLLEFNFSSLEDMFHSLEVLAKNYGYTSIDRLWDTQSTATIEYESSDYVFIFQNFYPSFGEKWPCNYKNGRFTYW